MLLRIRMGINWSTRWRHLSQVEILFDPAPIAPAPPYFPVQWIEGFTPQAPLGPGSSTQIDANGLLLVNPSLMGLFVVGVRVKNSEMECLLVRRFEIFFSRLWIAT